MKIGMRKPSIKRSISARTTGKLKRTINRTINPLYGKKGMGYINNPKKAIYNKVYNKTTVGVRDIVDSSKSKASKSSHNVSVESHKTETVTAHPRPSIDLSKYSGSSKKYSKSGTNLIIVSCVMAFAGLFTMPIGFLFIGLSILFFSIGKTHKKVAKLKQYNETDLPPLNDPYIDDAEDVWEVDYKYDYIDLQLIDKKFDDFKVNQKITFECTNFDCNLANPSSVRIMADGSHIGYINTLGQRQMILDYLQKDGYMVQAQFSFLSEENVFLRIVYYRSKKHREQEEAEARARYEAEKAAYIRKPPVSFDTTLVYNKNAEMQDDIQYVDIGETLSFEQEDDERYLAIAKEVLYLGYLPKKIASKIDELINDGYEVVDSKIVKKEYDDSYKYIVTVSIALEDTNYL